MVIIEDVKVRQGGNIQDYKQRPSSNPYSPERLEKLKLEGVGSSYTPSLFGLGAYVKKTGRNYIPLVKYGLTLWPYAKSDDYLISF